MTFDINDIYNEVQSGIAKTEEAMKGSRSQAVWREVMTFKPDKEYVLRIVPYTNCERNEIFNKTFFPSYQFGWTGADGKRVICTSARTLNLPCPIQEYRRGILNNGSDAEKEDMKKKLTFRTVHYFNVYVINDPVNSANNGTIKIVKAGTQIWNVVKAYIEGEYDDMVEGMSRKILDLSNNGANLVITPKLNQMKVPDYTNAVKFVTKGAALNFDEDKIKEIYESAHDLSKVDYIRSYDEAKKFFRESFLNGAVAEEAPAEVESPAKSVVDNVTAAVVRQSQPAPKSAPAASAAPNTEDDVDDFIKSLGDLG